MIISCVLSRSYIIEQPHSQGPGDEVDNITICRKQFVMFHFSLCLEVSTGVPPNRLTRKSDQALLFGFVAGITFLIIVVLIVFYVCLWKRRKTRKAYLHQHAEEHVEIPDNGNLHSHIPLVQRSFKKYRGKFGSNLSQVCVQLCS